MRFVPFILAVAATTIAAGSAGATTVFTGNFDAENSGNSALNYTGFSGVTVTSGSVDLVKSGDYGISCAGGSGSCVDLQGSTNQDSKLDITSFAFAANTLYTFSFDLSGNQRDGNTNNWFVGVNYDANNTYNFLRLGGAFGNFDVFQGFGTIGSSTGGGTAGGSPFQTYTFGFSLQNAGNATFYIGSDDAGNAGPIVDNFLITGSAVPEPQSWVMLIAGFGLVGAAARRRRGFA